MAQMTNTAPAARIARNLAAAALAMTLALQAMACDDNPEVMLPDAAMPDAAADRGSEVSPGDGPVPADAADAAGDATDAAAVAGYFPCEIEAVLKAKCHTCHVMPPINGAPMSLLTWADTQNLASGSTTIKIWQQASTYVASGYMPFITSPTGPLSDAEKAILLPGLQDGAPPATRACTGTDAGQ
jgi:hypothetical protein